MSEKDDETPVVERKLMLGNLHSRDSDHVDSITAPIFNLNLPATSSTSMLVPTPSIRNITRDEIFNTQGYMTQCMNSPPNTPGSVDTPGTATGSGSVDSGNTETGHPVHSTGHWCITMRGRGGWSAAPLLLAHPCHNT